MCKAIGVSKGGYYKWRGASPSQSELRKAYAKQRILYHFHDNEERYGSPKITHLLQEEKLSITERTVSIYMSELGLRSCVSRKFKVTTTDSNHDEDIAPNTLNQQFQTALPNQVWVTDITYIACRQHRLYLASVMDLCTREIVGWRLGRRMQTDLVLGALEDAYEAKMPAAGLLHHSDRGSQYASKEYRAKLAEYGMEASMSRTGNCYDNASMESFHSILKKELIYCRPTFKTEEHAYQAIFRYIEFFYNRKRIHGSLGYISPVRFAARFEGCATA